MGIDDRTAAGWSQSGGSSKSGLPSWAQKYVQTWLGNMASPAFTNYQKSLQALNKSDLFINQQRQLMGQQYTRDIQQPTQNAVGNAMNQFAGAGTMGSSMMGDWARNFGGQMNLGMQQAQNSANQWAAQSKLGMLGQRVNANASFADLMKQILGLSSTQSASNSSYSQGALPAGTNVKPTGGGG